MTWQQLNQRRLTLIDKDMGRGLSPSEEKELEDLEKWAEDYMATAFPISFEIIDRLKECAERDGLIVE